MVIHKSSPHHKTDRGDNHPRGAGGSDISLDHYPETAVHPDINYGKWQSTGKGLSSSAQVTQDGRIAVSLDLKHTLPDLPKDYNQHIEEFAVDTQWKQNPGMNIVIMIVGSRGDVQPYVALGQLLHKDGHRIRIASHETFRSFVNDSGLEFFNIGGDPKELMSYMVRNPGLMPGMESLTNGDIGRKRKMLAEMMNGCWLSCFSPCPITSRPFTAHAIISNPPTFAHVHCAEALGIPLQLTFTMPWCPTAEFPHPLVNINKSNAKGGLTNYLSYAMADILTWQGIGDVINDFRLGTLGLKPLTQRSGPSLVDRVKIPWTYCMSPALVPKPTDWANHIDVVGFYFLDLATSYQPADDLALFLAAGEAPIYIGFGSVVVADAAAMTQMIFDATAQAGVRALVSAGWGGLGGVSVPPHIFILGNIPHDWLFDEERVSAVIHHGGAGTTAIGLAKGRPTVVVPFFGDQGFWGSMIHKAGAGPEPIPHKQLNVAKLTEAIKFAISPSAKIAAKAMADQIKAEDGVRQGVDSFYKHLPLLNMRCDLDPSRVAVWWSYEHCMKLSAFAAQVLVDAKELEVGSLELHRSKEYDSQGPGEPHYETWSANAIFWTVTQSYAGFSDIFLRIPVVDNVRLAVKLGGSLKKVVSHAYTDMRQKGDNSEDQPGSNRSKNKPPKDKVAAYYDGVAGALREGENVKKDFRGAIKRSIGSLSNITAGPVVGVTNLVAQPFYALKEKKSSIADNWRLIYLTRVSEGVVALKNSTEAQQAEIIRKFKEVKPGTKERRDGYDRMRVNQILPQDSHTEGSVSTVHTAASKGS